MSNGTATTVVRDISVRVLQGTACATPVHLNPYVSYTADTTPTATTRGVVVTSQSSTAANASIYVPDLVAMAQQQASQDGAESMEEWVKRMSQELNGALASQMEAMFRKE